MKLGRLLLSAPTDDLEAMPRVSVAMAMRNSATTLRAALRSLQLQTLSDWELMLIDDGSVDDSVALARNLDDPRIQIVRDGEHRGLAARLNQAVSMARGRYIARMDADDIAYPERFERQIDFLQSHAEVDLLGCGMMVFRDDGLPVGGFPVHEAHETICAKPYSGFYLAHPSWMGRIEWFRRWRYDALCIKAQDQDLLLRAHRDSRFAVLPEVLMGYRQEHISLRKSLVGRWVFSQAIWRDARAHHRWIQGGAGVAMQAAKLGCDAVAVSTGLQRLLMKHRALAADAKEILRWYNVWTIASSK